MAWTPVVDTQTPGWLPVERSVRVAAYAFQPNAFQADAFSIFSLPYTEWVTVNDAQAPGWAPVDDSQ